MATGRGVRVAIVDSGVHASHPHVGHVAGGVAIDGEGRRHDDFIDRLGHGTAVAAAIREKAPDAELYAVKVFDRALSTGIASLVDGIDWASRNGMHVVNLSLGTPRKEHETALAGAVERAVQAHVLVVAARQDAGQSWLPGSLSGVLPVEIDWALPRDRYRSAAVDGVTVFYTSGFAREIPGVPPERNLHGISLAVANMTGLVARAIEGATDRSLAGVVGILEAAGDGVNAEPAENG
jgi:subtilisin family serine protease